MSSLDSIEIQQNFIDPAKQESESEYFDLNSVRRSQIAGLQLKWNEWQVAALEVASNVNPYEPDLPEGTIIPAVEAVGWSVGRRNCDIRPRLVDKSTGRARLIDSGSMITATVKGPEDKIDKSVRLVAVNGSEIKTYGVKQI